MPRNIEGKESRMYMTTLFESMSDTDFRIIWEQGQLRNFCNALSLDLHVRSDNNNNSEC
jgi:hypothetical protein